MCKIRSSFVRGRDSLNKFSSVAVYLHGSLFRQSRVGTLRCHLAEIAISPTWMEIECV